MRIWHVEVNTGPGGVDGLSSFVWTICREQARRGHDVTLFARTHLPDEALAFATDAGIRVVEAPRRSQRGVNPVPYVRALRRQRPSVVHVHGAWKPNHAVVAALLRAARIPYVYSPHGALASALMVLSPWRRSQYARFVEGPLVHHAAGLALLPTERADITRIAPRYRGAECTCPTPVELAADGSPLWRFAEPANRLVYLGRFEIFQKGIDRIVDVAGHARTLEFHLYGTTALEDRSAIEALARNAPPNVFFHDPIFGDQKHDVMVSASMYVQMSRFEGATSLAVAEAMCLGVPCAISESLPIARTFIDDDLGLVLPAAPAEAASALQAALQAPSQLEKWSTNALSYAAEHFGSGRAAERLIELYEEVIEARSTRRT